MISTTFETSRRWALLALSNLSFALRVSFGFTCGLTSLRPSLAFRPGFGAGLAFVFAFSSTFAVAFVTVFALPSFAFAVLSAFASSIFVVFRLLGNYVLFAAFPLSFRV